MHSAQISENMSYVRQFTPEKFYEILYKFSHISKPHKYTNFTLQFPNA